MPGFLGNIDEMLEGSDGEGPVWRVFVGQWWDRFGTAEVGTSGLYELAINCERRRSALAATDRTRLGKALARMRDRVFDIAGLRRGFHQARRWQLALEGEHGERGTFSGPVGPRERQDTLEQRSLNVPRPIY